MEPRNRAKEPVNENRRSGFRGKDPELETLQVQRQALVRAMRLDLSIFQEHLGKEVFIECESDTVLAKLEKVGIDFVKLTNVRMIDDSYDLRNEYEIKEFIRLMGLPENPEEGGPLFSGTLPSLVLNRSEIQRMVAKSDFE